MSHHNRLVSEIRWDGLRHRWNNFLSLYRWLQLQIWIPNVLFWQLHLLLMRAILGWTVLGAIVNLIWEDYLMILLNQSQRRRVRLITQCLVFSHIIEGILDLLVTILRIVEVINLREQVNLKVPSMLLWHEHGSQFFIKIFIGPSLCNLIIVELSDPLQNFIRLFQWISLLPRNNENRQDGSVDPAHLRIVLERKLALIKIEICSRSEIHVWVKQPQVIQLSELITLLGGCRHNISILFTLRITTQILLLLDKWRIVFLKW